MNNRRKLIIGFSVSICILGILVFARLYNKNDYLAQIISEDLEKLVKAIDSINKDCEISSIDHHKIPITFLNIISFTGSEVGSINLVHPENWKGPYLSDNPTINGIEYQLVRAKDGYFIIPGDGVKLPNGKIMGKDIIITESTHIKSLIKEKNTFCYKEWCTVGHLNFEKGLKNVYEQILLD